MIKRFTLALRPLVFALCACYFLAGPTRAADEMPPKKLQEKNTSVGKTKADARAKGEKSDDLGSGARGSGQIPVKGKNQERAFSVCDTQPTLCRD